MKKILNGLVIALLAIIIGGCGVPQPWKAAGFNGNEQKGFQYEDYEKLKIAPRDALYFKMQHISPSKAKEWLDAGISGEEMDKWKYKGIENPSIAKEWLDAGISSREMTEWKEAGITNPSIAKEWKKEDLSPDAAKDIGGIDELRKWQNGGFAALDARYHIRQKRSIIKAKQYDKWLKLVESDCGILCNKEGTANLFLDENIDYNRAVEVKKAGGFSFNFGEIDYIVAWAKTDAASEVIKKYKNLDPAYLNVKDLNNIMKYCSKVENGYLSSKTPFVTEGKCFDYYGEVTKIRNQKSVEIEECVKTDNQFDDCMGGRVSILNFVKNIPDSMTRGSNFRSMVLGGGNVKEYLFGNSSENTEVIFPILED